MARSEAARRLAGRLPWPTTSSSVSGRERQPTPCEGKSQPRPLYRELLGGRGRAGALIAWCRYRDLRGTCCCFGISTRLNEADNVVRAAWFAAPGGCHMTPRDLFTDSNPLTR